ncbi:MAG TPA: hypothetical protein VJ576_03465 [Rhodocyclaceae bacterium]|nr:hypothetical protein [Rhodocyclaceae bacterium]
MSPALQQFHGRNAFDRSQLIPGRARPALRIQFHAPVHFENIRGPFQFSFQLEAPAIVWGRDGRCWAFLHDFDLRSVQLILEQCREATYDRRGAFAHPFGFNQQGM